MSQHSQAPISNKTANRIKSLYRDASPARDVLVSCREPLSLSLSLSLTSFTSLRIRGVSKKTSGLPIVSLTSASITPRYRSVIVRALVDTPTTLRGLVVVVRIVKHLDDHSASGCNPRAAAQSERHQTCTDNRIFAGSFSLEAMVWWPRKTVSSLSTRQASGACLSSVKRHAVVCVAVSLGVSDKRLPHY